MTLLEWLPEQSLTREQFARRIGVAHTTVNRWVRGETFPRGRQWRLVQNATAGQVSVPAISPPDAPPPRHPDAPASAEKVAAE